MSESPEKGFFNSLSSPLVSEIVELRQLKSENETLKSLTSIFKTQIAEMEIEISELKAEVSYKDYEIQKLKERRHVRSNSSTLSRVNLANESNSKPGLLNEIFLLKSLLDSERQEKISFESQLKSLRSGLERLSEHFESRSSKNAEKLEEIIERLIEENKLVKVKGNISEVIEPSTEYKSINSSDIRFSIETESESLAESTPRVEGNIGDIQESPGFECSFPIETPKKYLNPEPPKTRWKSDYPKKAKMPGRGIKYVNCNLIDILETPQKYRSAEFCPSGMRRFK